MFRKIATVASLLLVLAFLLCACGEIVPNADGDKVNDDTELSDSSESDGVLSDEENKEDKKEDKPVKNILMIGHSCCYYYVEELCGVAAAAGYDINLCNLYYSGCSLVQHWSFYTENKDCYEFYHTTKDGRVKTEVKTFQGALDYARENLGSDWEVISLIQGPDYFISYTLQDSANKTNEYASKLYNVIRESSPDAKLYWLQSWAFEVGSEGYGVSTVRKQTQMHEMSKSVSSFISVQQKVDVVPITDAWQLARNVAPICDDLCRRILNGKEINDHGHDGDIGGGQYLNACVWFEVLFKESCIGNTWRPDYELSEEKINVLQRAAHQAVAELYGSDYAK